MLNRVTFSKYLALVLRALNVKVLFTLPGDLTLELLSSLEADGIRILCFPDEESVMSAADIFASLSGLSLVICSDGYSLSKMINPLVACRLRYSPVQCWSCRILQLTYVRPALIITHSQRECSICVIVLA